MKFRLFDCKDPVILLRYSRGRRQTDQREAELSKKTEPICKVSRASFKTRWHL